MEAHNALSRHVEQIHKRAAVIVGASRSQAKYGLLEVKGAGTRYHCEFTRPTLFWKVPLRASGQRTQETKSRAILVGGTFTFENERLVNTRTRMVIYDARHYSSRHELTLLDAYHFDTENEKPQPYHPFFHVQRGRIKGYGFDPDDVAELVASVSKVEASAITISNGDDAFATRDVRIPTPHMDYTAVLANVFADFFCEKGGRGDIHRGFKSLLELVMNINNPTHDGLPLTKLKGRWAPPTASALCAAHWYAESAKSHP